MMTTIEVGARVILGSRFQKPNNKCKIHKIEILIQQMKTEIRPKELAG